MPEETPPISNAFTRMLQELNKGASLAELSEAMQKCVAAARETGASAEIKYAVKFSPNGEAMAVTDKIDIKLPSKQRKGAIFFPTEDNNLSRANPDQRELELREVKKETPAELKEPVRLQATAS